MDIDWPSFLAGALAILFVDRTVGFARRPASKSRKAGSSSSGSRKGAADKRLVRQAYIFDPVKSTHTLQLPIAFRTEEYNAGSVPDSLRAHWVKEKREHIWRVLRAQMPSFARCVPGGKLARIEFVRIGPKALDDDNLMSAFKGLRDALCAFLVWGDQCDENVRQIGQADERVRRSGVIWNYRQEQHPADPSMYGVKFVLHCGARASSRKAKRTHRGFWSSLWA